MSLNTSTHTQTSIITNHHHDTTSSNSSTADSRDLRREFRKQQSELLELTALGLNRGKTIEDLGCCWKKMEEQNLELEVSMRGARSSTSSTSNRPSFASSNSFHKLTSHSRSSTTSTSNTVARSTVPLRMAVANPQA